MDAVARRHVAKAATRHGNKAAPVARLVEHAVQGAVGVDASHEVVAARGEVLVQPPQVQLEPRLQEYSGTRASRM